MKVVFFGSSIFSKIVLETLIENKVDITGIVTRIPKSRGRGKIKQPTSVSLSGKEKGIDIYETEDLHLPEFQNWFKNKKVDILLLASFGKIIPEYLLEMVKFPINIHPSLLPRYRGAAPIRRAVMNNEEITGITIFKMTEKMDAGDIISQCPVNILKDEVATELEKRLAEKGGKEFIKIYRKLEEGKKIKFTPQQDNSATYTKKIKKPELKILWDEGCKEIIGKIRGLAMSPGAYTFFRGKRIKILRASPSLITGEMPGKIIKFSKDGIITTCKGGSIMITLLKPEGKNIITSSDFINGYRVKQGELFKEV